MLFVSWVFDKDVVPGWLVIFPNTLNEWPARKTKGTVMAANIGSYFDEGVVPGWLFVLPNTADTTISMYVTTSIIDPV